MVGGIMKINKTSIIYQLSLLTLCLYVSVVNYSAQTGGQYAITQSVVAAGGNNSNGGNFGLTGTTAQSTAGINSADGQFTVTGGFWQVFFAPTAALVSVGGRITEANGNGIPRVLVLMTNTTGQTQSAVSNSFGHFRFAEVAAGETYIFTVYNRHYQFGVPTRVLAVNDHISDLVFIADW